MGGRIGEELRDNTGITFIVFVLILSLLHCFLFPFGKLETKRIRSKALLEAVLYCIINERFYVVCLSYEHGWTSGQVALSGF